MSLTLLVFWALVGICPEMPRIRWPWPSPPPPEPWWRWWTYKFVGILGGLLGGWLYTQVWPTVGIISGVDVAATAIGAFVGAVILMNVYGLATEMVRGRQKAMVQH